MGTTFIINGKYTSGKTYEEVSEYLINLIHTTLYSVNILDSNILLEENCGVYLN